MNRNFLVEPSRFPFVLCLICAILPIVLRHRGVLGGDTCEGYIYITDRVFLEGTPARGTSTLLPGCSWRGHLRGVHIHYCLGVLGGDTCEGYIFITARVFLEGTPAMDAKSLWEAIKSRFRGNEESKKIQKNVLKYQFENFTTAPMELMDKVMIEVFIHSWSSNCFKSSLSPHPTQPSPSPELIQPTHEAEETAFVPYDSPLHDVHSHGSAEGSMQQHDLTILVNKLNDRIDRLEKVLQQTKKTYSTALTKLELRVKKLEYKLKSGKARRKVKIVLSDDEQITVLHRSIEID
ncbi:hypothetical protein Tco_0482599 [Tanacetum coccineum]